MSDIFPITEEEAEKLHQIGWESGFGWKQGDWYHQPSFGPIIHIADNLDWRKKFETDLLVARQIIAAAKLREGLSKCAEDVEDVLLRCLEYFDKRADAEIFPGSPRMHGNEEMGLFTDIKSILDSLEAIS